MSDGIIYGYCDLSTKELHKGFLAAIKRMRLAIAEFDCMYGNRETQEQVRAILEEVLEYFVQVGCAIEDIGTAGGVSVHLDKDLYKKLLEYCDKYSLTVRNTITGHECTPYMLQCFVDGVLGSLDLEKMEFHEIIERHIEQRDERARGRAERDKMPDTAVSRMVVS